MLTTMSFLIPANTTFRGMMALADEAPRNLNRRSTMVRGPLNIFVQLRIAHFSNQPLGRPEIGAAATFFKSGYAQYATQLLFVLFSPYKHRHWSGVELGRFNSS